MAQNRSLPYGYKIESGKILAEPNEQRIVIEIFTRYAEGESYKSIAVMLTERDIRYMPCKAGWNKNMVARILQNSHYTEGSKYPPIVDSALFQKAQAAMKPYTRTVSPHIKALKPLLICHTCGAALGRRVKANGGERWYCPTDTGHISPMFSDELLVKEVLEIMRNPAIVTSEDEQHTVLFELSALQNEVDRLFAEPTPNVTLIQEKLKRLAELRYEKCRDAAIAPTSVANGSLEDYVPLLRNIYVHVKSVKSILLTNKTLIEKGVPQNE